MREIKKRSYYTHITAQGLIHLGDANIQGGNAFKDILHFYFSWLTKAINTRKSKELWKKVQVRLSWLNLYNVYYKSIKFEERLFSARKSIKPICGDSFHLF